MQVTILPNDMILHSFRYLDDKAIIATTSVCKEWNNPPLFKAERVKARQRIALQKVHCQMIYGKIAGLFRMNLLKLPPMDIRTHQDPFVDTYAEVRDMDRSIKRFDTERGPGIAFRLQAISKWAIRETGADLGVLVLHKESPDHWRFSWRDEKEGTIAGYCQFEESWFGWITRKIARLGGLIPDPLRVDEQFFSTILAGKNSHFQIAEV